MAIYYGASSLKASGSAGLKKRNGMSESAPKSGFPRMSVRGKGLSMKSNKKSY